MIYPDVMFYGDGPIVIGDNTTIGNGTIHTEYGTRLGTPIKQQANSSSKVEMGDDAWLACNVTVLKGSRIGDGAVVGAKALVKGELANNSISFGIPVKVINFRTND